MLLEGDLTTAVKVDVKAAARRRARDGTTASVEVLEQAAERSSALEAAAEIVLELEQAPARRRVTEAVAVSVLELENEAEPVIPTKPSATMVDVDVMAATRRRARDAVAVVVLELEAIAARRRVTDAVAVSVLELVKDAEPVSPLSTPPVAVKVELDLPTPAWAVPLLEPARYKGAKGGRSGGKSHFFAELAVVAVAWVPSLRNEPSSSVVPRTTDFCSGLRRLPNQFLRAMAAP